MSLLSVSLITPTLTTKSSAPLRGLRESKTGTKPTNRKALSLKISTRPKEFTKDKSKNRKNYTSNT